MTEAEAIAGIKAAAEAREQMEQQGENVPADVRARLVAQIDQGQEAATALILQYRGLVRQVAGRMGRPKEDMQGLDYKDLYQEGALGLLSAAKRYDPARGAKFMTYARQRIINRASKAIKDQGRNIRLPVHSHDKLRRSERRNELYEEEIMQPPTQEESAEFIKISVKAYREFMLRTRPTESIETREELLGVEDLADDPDNLPLEQVDAELEKALSGQESDSPEEQAIRGQLRQDVRQHMQRELSERERKIIELRFGFDSNKPKP